MKLDKFSDYALRLLIALAVHSPSRLSAAKIAKLYDLSDNHLSKIASALVAAGFITSQRGRSGGLSLAQAADKISVGAVLRSMKDRQPVAECFGSNKSCKILPACGLREPLQVAQEAFFAALDPVTLAEVSGKNTALKLLIPMADQARGSG